MSKQTNNTLLQLILLYVCTFIHTNINDKKIVCIQKQCTYFLISYFFSKVNTEHCTELNPVAALRGVILWVRLRFEVISYFLM